ncbi:MAG: thioesterase family protein [Neisseriaceae bacterium]
MLFKTPIKVRGYHLDLYQHVNNARYLEFLEAARWDMLREVALMEKLHGSHLALVIVNLNIDYRSAALFEDELEVQSQFMEVKERKGVIKQIIINTKTGALVVEAKVTYVIIDMRTKKATRLPSDLMDFFTSLIPSDVG